MSIYRPFIDTVATGITNPYGLAAVAATGKHESGYAPKNAFGAWSDPSERGQAGTAGGILSWRAERLQNLRKFAADNGDDPNAPSPEIQAQFFLQEDPALVDRLNSAGSVEEAQSLMNGAWKFAGYNRAGGEASNRLATARSILGGTEIEDGASGAGQRYTRDLNTGSSTMAGYPTGLGGLGGLGMMAEEEPQAPQGFAGYLNDPGISDVLRATFASMMSSPSNNMLAAVPDMLPQLQKQRQVQEALGIERQDKLNNQRAMQAALMGNGFSPEEAVAYASNPQAANLAIAGREEAAALGQQNRTLEYLRTAFPEIAAQVDAGLPVSEAFKLASEERKNRMEGVKTSPEAQKIADREAAAGAQGLTPGTPEYRAYVLTGSMPSAERNVTAGDRQAIREADDQVMTADNAEIALQKALGLSGGALEGWTAPLRGSIANNLPDAMVPDWLVGSPEEGQATAELDNTVTAGALEQMKAIFGGNPTEGERAILLEIQGSSNQPKKVREAIYNRALDAVRRKREFNKDRAQELRGGDYYSPDRPTKGSGIRQKYGLE